MLHRTIRQTTIIVNIFVTRSYYFSENVRSIFLRAKMRYNITLSPSSCRLPHAVSSVAITASHLTVLCTPTIVNETPSSATSSILYEFAARCARFKALWLIFIQLRCYLLFLFWYFFLSILLLKRQIRLLN